MGPIALFPSVVSKVRDRDPSLVARVPTSSTLIPSSHVPTDFLPFRCDCCNLVYCLDHRSYIAHTCASSQRKDHRAVVCPLCARTIHFLDGQDVNAQFSLHRATDCAPESRAARVERKRCAAPGCREKLLLSNKATCAVCRQELCLAHRHADAHACPGPASKASWLGLLGGGAASSAAVASGGVKPRPVAPASAAVATTTASNAPGTRSVVATNASTSGGTALAGSGSAAATAAAPARPVGRPAPPPSAAAASARRPPQRAPRPVDPSNTLLGSAARRARPPPVAAPAEAPASAHSAEPSPFSTGALAAGISGGISAVGSFLGGSPRSSSGGGSGGSRSREEGGFTSPAASSAGEGEEVCPQCGSRFRDVAVLVAHVESAHPSQHGGRQPPLRVGAAAFHLQQPVAPSTVDSASSFQSSSGGFTGGSSGPAAQLEPCPVCSTPFPDAPALVAHVQSAHAEHWHQQRAGGILPPAAFAGGGRGAAPPLGNVES